MLNFLKQRKKSTSPALIPASAQDSPTPKDPTLSVHGDVDMGTTVDTSVDEINLSELHTDSPEAHSTTGAGLDAPHAVKGPQMLSRAPTPSSSLYNVVTTQIESNDPPNDGPTLTLSQPESTSHPSPLIQRSEASLEATMKDKEMEQQSTTGGPEQRNEPSMSLPRGRTQLNLSQYAPADARNATKHNTRARRGSAPPAPLASLTTSSSDAYEKSMNSQNYPFAISSNAPAKVQLLNWLQHWALWTADMVPEHRLSLNNVIGQKMESIWIDAMRMDLIPRDWMDADFPGSVKMPIKVVELDKRGRLVQETSKQKRNRSPSKEIIIDTRHHKGSNRYGITAGELQEAGVSWQAIQERIGSDDLEAAGDELLEQVLDGTGRDYLMGSDWMVNQTRTPHNRFGRDLKKYCLWEAQRSEKELEILAGLRSGFHNANQIRNTENRIDAEKVLRDQLLALALELDSLEHSGSASDIASQEGSEMDLEQPESEDDAEVVEVGDTDSQDIMIVTDHSSTEEDRTDEPQANARGGSNPTTRIEDQYDSLATHQLHESLERLSEPSQIGRHEHAAAQDEKSAKRRLVHDVDDDQKFPAKRIRLLNDVTQENSEQQMAITRDEIAVDAPLIPATDAPEMQDVEGYPSQQDIFNAFTREGLNFREIQEHFDYTFDSSNTTWRALVQSVTSYDRDRKHFYRREELAEKLRFRKAIFLKIKPGFKPEDFSSRTVTNSGGFRWRFTNSSSPAQREAMDEVIDYYVKATKSQQPRPFARDAKNRSLHYNRYGRYEVLINPADVRLDYHNPIFEPTPIVHGIWDHKGRKNEDKRIDGWDWFYNGEGQDEPVKTFVMRQELLHGDIFRSVREEEIDGVTTEDQAQGLHLAYPSSTLIRSTPTLKLNITNPSTPEPGKHVGFPHQLPTPQSHRSAPHNTLALTPTSGPATKGKEKWKGKGKGRPKGSKTHIPPLNKTPEATRAKRQANQPIALGRARRATVTKSYVGAADGWDDSDGDFVLDG